MRPPISGPLPGAGRRTGGRRQPHGTRRRPSWRGAAAFEGLRRGAHAGARLLRRRKEREAGCAEADPEPTHEAARRLHENPSPPFPRLNCQLRNGSCRRRRRRRRRRRFARPRARRAPPLNTTHCGGRHEEARHRAPAGWKGRGFLRARRRRGVRTAGGTPRCRGWRLALRLFGYRWCECTHLLPNKLWYFTLLPATGPTWGETGLPAAPGTP